MGWNSTKNNLFGYPNLDYAHLSWCKFWTISIPRLFFPSISSMHTLFSLPPSSLLIYLLIKNTFLCFNINMYTFQIHYSTFHKPYILMAYTTIPLLYSNIFPYTSIYVETNLKLLYFALLCLVTFYIIFQSCHGASLLYKNVLHLPWHVYWNSKMKHIPWTHKFYWLIKYLNPKSISWDSIITCWTYICQ